MKNKRRIIAVIGNADDAHVSQKTAKIAYETGREIAKNGCVMICGGMGGVMKYACKGAKSEKGTTIGVLPFFNKKKANKFIDVPLCTGMAIGLRDNIIVHSADAIIAIGGGSGTIGEIAVAYMYKKPLIMIDGTGGWVSKLNDRYIDERKKMRIIGAKNAEDAVKLALKLVERGKNNERIS